MKFCGVVCGVDPSTHTHARRSEGYLHSVDPLPVNAQILAYTIAIVGGEKLFNAIMSIIALPKALGVPRMDLQKKDWSMAG